MKRKKAPAISYLLSCLLLLVPVMVWNSVFAKALPPPFQPAVFWHHIPAVLRYTENISRTIIFLIAALTPLSAATVTQRRSLMLYMAGLCIYFASWVVVMRVPYSIWRHSYLVFSAPAYTPLCWLMGIALAGRRFYFGLPFHRRVFVMPSIVFLLSHNIHTYIVYCRLQ